MASPSQQLPIKSYFQPGGLLERVLPRFESREQQVVMARAVQEAILSRSAALIEAGTGTGKTLAYLIPAALAGQRVVVSTGTKALQDQLLNKDVPILRKLFPDLNVVVMKGRNNYYCHYRASKFAHQRNIYDQTEERLYDQILNWSGATITGDRAEIPGLPDDFRPWVNLSATSETCLGSKCPEASKCFYNAAKERTFKADIIIVNHSMYLAHAAIRKESEESGGILPPHDVVVFDEAHLLEDIATGHLGTVVSNFQFSDLLGDIRREAEARKLGLASKTYTLADTVQYRADLLFSMFPGEPGTRYEMAADWWDTSRQQLVTELVESMEGLRGALDELKGSEEVGRLRERCTDLAAEVRFVTNPGTPDFVYYYEPFRRGAAVSATPIHIAELLQEYVFRQVGTAVLTSATLSTNGDFSYLKSRLGLVETSDLVLDSPFDYATQGLLYVPKGFAQPDDRSFPEAVLEEVVWLTSRTKGRALVLFTSVRMMQFVAKGLKGKTPYPFYVQGERPKKELLADFAANVSSILLATSSFWQGIDIRGEALSAVIIDKLPFGVPSDPVEKARIEKLRQEGKNPFMSYQVPNAILTLKQGVGRLIRSKEDTGLICILDGRLHTKPYGRQFLASMPPCKLVTTRKEVERTVDAYIPR